MKIQEEIEQLAESEYREYPNNPLDEPAWHYNKDIHCNKKRKAFIKGYTQCQEEMADKKYTEEDIRKAIEVGVNAEAGDYPKGFTYKLGITLEDYFINSLNKQD
jgi:hypothetical protein